MAMAEMSHRREGESDIVLERTFQAPRELVFRAFTSCEHLENWWGPRGWELPVCRLDLRPGGTWEYAMRCADESQPETYGMESWGKAVYREIEEPRSLVYTDYFTDAEGIQNPDLPASETSVEFIDVGGSTQIVSRSRYSSKDDLDTVMAMGMLDGVAQTWDRLEEHLAKLM